MSSCVLKCISKKPLCCDYVYMKTLPTRELNSIPKAYTPRIENKIYERWEQSGLFHSDELSNGQPFSMILPPPNVTGNLHLGHALTITLQDTIARHQRMCGNNVIWVPGTDHAGIATQVIVEKELRHKLNKSRYEIGREDFIKHVWKWKNSKVKDIAKQIKKLGASVDWSKEYFTLDNVQSASVKLSLLKLWDDGLVYRDETLVNWSCLLQSTISDIEIDYVSITEPTKISIPNLSKPVTFGRLIEFAYKIDNSDDEIIVSTTRVETMTGDVAVAVHPNDHRYNKYIGSKLMHPFTSELIPVIADKSVNQSFGTGAVKITPSHDQTDFEIGKKHKLPLKTVINENGYMNANSGQFAGLHRFEAREKIINVLKEKGLLRNIKPHQMNVPKCSRSGDIIEFLIKPQWFLNCQEMGKRAADAVRNGNLVIEPERYRQNWFSWLDGIKDWCISRQLWWGHQVPFYNCKDGTSELWIAANDESEALVIARKSLSGNVLVERDSDVLDTWFSSALLPFSSLGWLNKDKQFQQFYPLDLMVTGHDILFFWVARMTMLGLHLTNSLPFKKVLLHSIVCDFQGRKMSKSSGNVIDPIDIIDGCELKSLIKQISEKHVKGLLNEHEASKAIENIEQTFPKGITDFGSDALRFSLLSHNLKNPFMNFNVSDCYGNKLFCNKIWQANNFACIRANKFQLDYSFDELPDNLSDMDLWILSQLAQMVDVIHSSFYNHDFHLMTNSLRSFLYGDLCDVYIESLKPLPQNETSAKISTKVLLYCLEVALRCIAPSMPFVAEILYSELPNKKAHSVMNTPFPSRLKFDNKKIKEKVDLVIEIVNSLRRMKSENGIRTHKANACVISDEAEGISSFLYVIEALTKCVVKFSYNAPSLPNVKEAVRRNTEIYLLLNQESIMKKNKNIDTTAISKKISKLENALKKLIEMTSTQAYQKKVADNVKEAHTLKITKLKQELSKLKN